MLNRGCNLECVKKGDKGGDEVIEFVGPVKIVLVDQPKDTYRHKTWAAAFITLAQMLMATSTIIVVFYSLNYPKKKYLEALHIFLCTIGFQLGFPTGVLMLNNLTGAAAPMHISDRKIEHAVLQIFSLILVISGIYSSYYAQYPTFYTTHSYSGLVACGIAQTNMLVGIIAYILTTLILKNKLRLLIVIILICHRILGILTIISSSVCFVSGILKFSFKNWLPISDMFYALIIFCVFYTIVVIYKPFKNL